MSNKLKQLFLFLGDIAIFYFSLYATLLIRYQTQPSQVSWENHFIPFSSFLIFWLIIFYISNLYNITFAINNAKFFNKSISSIGVSGLLSVVYFYINPNLGIAPKTNLFIFLIVFTILFILWRLLFNRTLYSFLPKNNIAVIGHNKQVDEITDNLKNNPHLGYNTALTIKNFSQIDTKLVDLVKKYKIDTIILAQNPDDSSVMRSQLIACLTLKINIINFAKFYEQITGKVPIEAISQMWFLENLNESNKSIFDLCKRLYDIIFAVLLLTITAIFWPIIGMIIKMESNGPIFFKQTRRGKHGQDFTIIKFRTMRMDNNDFTPTEKRDTRITKFGNFLRVTRIDEIPQILNIIIGDMSFIGPRPERPEIIKELLINIPYYKERMLVKPGLSGWDQVSGEYHSPSISDSIEKLQYDLFYIKNRSIYLDLSIILKTISTILSRVGR
jgi:exopolysaccharide biosynthesis polyprenyl glycosylphosphotransferase